MSSRYEFVEHTADIAIQAFGDNLSAAFEAAGTGLTDLLTGGATSQSEETMTFEVTADDQEGLLIRFLSEIVFLLDAEQIVLSEFKINLDSDTKLTAIACSQPFDPHRHGGGMLVKGVSYHNLQIETGANDQLSRIWVLLDV